MAKVDSDSSSEEYFDAEDTTRLSNRSTQRPSTVENEYSLSKPEPEIRIQTTEDDISNKTPTTRSPNLSIRNSNEQHMFVEPKPLGLSGRQRFRDLRYSLQNDEDENIGNTLTPDSQNSSSDGVYTNRQTHPFRIIENDTVSVQSMTSLGRVGKILAGSIDASGLSVDRDSIHSSALLGNSLNITQTINSKPVTVSSTVSNIPSFVQNSEKNIPIEKGSKLQLVVQQPNNIVKEEALSKISPEDSSNSSNSGLGENMSASSNIIILQEPDVIASTKLAHSKTTDSITLSGPIAPPRRKKKIRKLSSSSSEQFNMNEGLKLPPMETDDQISLQSISISKKCNEMVKELEKTWGQAVENKTAEYQHFIQKQSTIPSTINFAVTTTTSSSTTSRPNASAAAEVNSSIESGSINRISHSLGNSSTSVYSKPSPSNSAKSNSAPGRVRYFSIDPTQGLNLYKVTQGVCVVQPKDDAANKAEGPSQEEIERIEKLLREEMSRPKLAGTGSNSLGSGSRYDSQIVQRVNTINEQRRKSAGDEDVLKQMNIYVRTRTDSGKQLTDKEILDQVPVKNLDTGENMPLSSVRPPPIPEGWNPLSLHIHKLYGHLPVSQKESDEESIIGIPPNVEVQPGEEGELETEDVNGRLKKRTQKIKRFFGSTMRKTVDKAKSLASEVSHARHKEDVADIVDVVNPELNIKIKASSSNKGPYEFAKLQHVQDLSGEHTGAVWCMKYSSCGRLLATAGQDKILRIWVLKDAYPFFQDMWTKYNSDEKSSPTPSQESLVSQLSIDQEAANAMAATAADKSTGPFMPKAFCSYIGHTSDLLDVSWSKNYFILSSSMDKTVRLWHISRKECLCCFQHIDFVTAIAFHPRDDRYFLSGSLDGKLRLWNIPDKKVALWNEVDGQTKLITAANFCQNGQFSVVGTYDGRCIFYTTDQLKYHTQINVRSTRGKNRIGRKISGIEPMPGEDKILVTSNDSRIRLYDLRDLNLSCKYKGYLNVSSQIKASFSHDGKYIVAGSENQCIYIWKTNHDCAKLSSVRRDRSDFWEGIKAHNAQVTCAIFTPHPEAIIKPEPDDEISNDSLPNIKADPLVEQRKKGCGYVLISADFNGAIKVFINKTKPKHSSLPYTAIE